MFIKKKRFWFLIITIIVIALIVYSCSGHKKTAQETMAVKKGDIAEKVIAVGSIVPRHSISVKSTVSGIVGQLFHEEGDYVEQGALLLQVTPSPTPEAIAEAHEQVREYQAALDQVESHRNRLDKLMKLNLETPDNYALAVKEVNMTKAKLEMSQQKLALMQKGEATIAGKQIKTMINSPINGYILQRKVDEGDPVVPLTDAQEGTVLFVIANMDDLIFKGTVNEIDVGKIAPDMVADINIAALPDIKIKGRLRKVDLQSNNAQDTTSTASSPFNVGFNIELNQLQFPKGIRLRAGYSATAEITIKKAEHVLMVPERVLSFKDDKVFVNILNNKNKVEEKEIKIGISDGINAEVLAGLAEGQTIIKDQAVAKG